MKIILLSSICILQIGCTTIGQQIVNHDGTLRVDQQNVPFSAQATPDTSAAVGFYVPEPVAIAPIYPTNNIFTNTITTNTVTITNNKTEQLKSTNSINTFETNNVTVNVYTETVNIEKSSFLSDAFNYFFSE